MLATLPSIQFPETEGSAANCQLEWHLLGTETRVPGTRYNGENELAVVGLMT